MNVYSKRLVEGVTLPAIIHNSSYFLINMAVYENGTVSCWHRSDLTRFKSDLSKGWVVPSVPTGKMLSVHALGDFPVLDAHWQYNAENFYSHVENVVRRLNPEMANIYRITQRETAKWDKARVEWSASPTPFKRKEGLGYNMLEGEACYIFYRQQGNLHLTAITAYADKTLSIDAAGDRVFTREEVKDMFADQTLLTSPDVQEWVTIEGLGQVLLGQSDYGELSPEEKYKEITGAIARMANEEDAHDRCMNAYYQYLTEPSEWVREALRKAYEDVPEHQRMYLGDMDSRDSDFIRILYHPEQKREV